MPKGSKRTKIGRVLVGAVDDSGDDLGMRAKAKDTPTPSERTEKYYAARPCPELCRYAADLLDKYLKNKKG